MRTKVLICAAALAAVSAFTTMAQNVYSLNVVGYIQVPLVEGFNLVANQLDFDGTGLDNTPANIFSSNLPVGSVIYGWAVGGGYNIANYKKNLITGLTSWTVQSGVMPSLNPGQGFWLDIPTGGLAGTSSNFTSVGQVDQGTLVNTNLAAGNASGGFGLVSSIAPLTGGITSVLGYSPSPGDTVYQWNTTPGVGYTINNYKKNLITGTTAWTLQSGPTGSPAEPTLSLGEGFWLNSGATSAWSFAFTVQ